MKKVLILAYEFPPYSSVGGLRPYSWFKYFKFFGVEPIVITRQWGKTIDNHLDYRTSSKENKTIYENLDYGLILRTPYKSNLANRIYLKYGENKFSFLRKIISAYYEIGQYLFKIGPKKQIYFGAKEFLKNNKVDAIIATGDPFVLFKYASILSKEFEVPWLADYRDDWIENHVIKDRKSILHKILVSYYRFFEKRIIKNVHGITSVSDYLLDQIMMRSSVKNGLVIENGADLELYIDAPTPYNNSEFNILYSGRLYDLSYLDDFVIGFEKMLKKYDYSSKIKVHFIGTEVSSNMATVTLANLKNKYPQNIILEQTKSTKDIAQFQLHANLLLNLIAGDPEKGLIGAKSYNYAVTKNPILTISSIKNRKSAFFPDRDIQFIAIDGNEVFNFLDLHYSNLLEGKKWKSSLSEIEKYELSRKYNTEKLIQFIFKNGNTR